MLSESLPVGTGASLVQGDASLPLQEKLLALRQNLSTYDHLAIAFSGGVDSTFLLMMASEVLGPRALAISMVGKNFAPNEFLESKRFCEKHNIPHVVCNMPEDIFASIATNPPDRCYICKKGLFQHMKMLVGDTPLADGTNHDDLSLYRPGLKALRELGIVSPLAECGFTKEDIRTALKAMNLTIWNKPAYACLATRFPYGTTLTEEKMRTVYELEAFIRDLGFPQVRVRHHGTIAIVEVPPEDRQAFARPTILDAVHQRMRQAGFLYATMDLAGFVSGSMDRELDK